jgi:kynurenine formamidase
MLRWTRRPEGSNWGDFGVDDQIGRLNLLTPEKVREGISEVRVGLTFCLSLPLDYPGGTALNPHRLPPVLRPGIRHGRPFYLYKMEQEDPAFVDVFNDDVVLMHLQYSTQWDSLAHVGRRFDADDDGVAESVFYNGYRGGTDIKGPASAEDCGILGVSEPRSTSGADWLGIENMAERCIQGRAVMLDVHAHFGPRRRAVGYDDLMRIIDTDGVVVRPGDLVCIHTGFAQAILDMKKNLDIAALRAHEPGLDGRDVRLLKWIADSGIVALIADNEAVEIRMPSDAACDCAALPLHEHCLFKLGINLGELWHLTPLAAWLRKHERTAFLLTAPPLRLTGAVGSPVTPVATV